MLFRFTGTILKVGTLLLMGTLVAPYSMGATVLMGKTGQNGTWTIYEWANESADWDTATANAALKTETVLGTGLQAILPEVRTDAANTFIKEGLAWHAYNNTETGATWLGASDQVEEGLWVWSSDGTEFYYEPVGAVNGWTSYWKRFEPNGGTEENLAAMDLDGMISVDSNNQLTYWYAYETSMTELNPTGTEAPTGKMILDPHTGRYYELLTDNLNFHAAKYLAESHNHNGTQGRLVVLNNAQESAFASVCANGKAVLTGLTDDPNYGGVESQTWVWAGPNGTSTPLTETGYVNWLSVPPQPDNTAGIENYAEVSYCTGAWNDVSEYEGRCALVEFGQDQEIAKGFYHRRVSASLSAATSAEAMDAINGISATSSEVIAQTATYNFVDIFGGTAPSSIAGAAGFPSDNINAGEGDFVMKSYVTVEIPAAGTYTFGGHQSDLLMLSMDRGAQEAVSTSFASGGSDLTGVQGTVEVTFDAPGNYNIYCLFANNDMRASTELAVAAGSYGAYEDFVANANPVGDTLNGALATKNLRQIYTQNGFSVNGASADTLNISSVEERGGSFGGDQTIAAGSEIIAISKLVVPENSGGWWTLGVSQSQEGSLTITKNGQSVAFSQANGDTNNAAVDAGGAMVWDDTTDTDDYVDYALGAIYLGPGTYDISLDYNPNHESFSLLGGDIIEQLELFAAAGVYSEFGMAFDLLGSELAFEDQSEFTGEVSVKIPGDANNDGKVDGSDVTILAGNWQYGVDGNGTATWAMGDFNGDGKVDGSDVTILAGNWQYGVSASAASVPEPSMLILLLGCASMFYFFRSRK